MNFASDTDTRRNFSSVLFLASKSWYDINLLPFHDRMGYHSCVYFFVIVNGDFINLQCIKTKICSSGKLILVYGMLPSPSQAINQTLIPEHLKPEVGTNHRVMRPALLAWSMQRLP